MIPKTLIMKLFFACLTLLLVHTSPAYLVLDRDLKKPPVHTSSFTTEQYLQRGFPVYVADVEAVTEAIDRAVKAIDKSSACNGVETIFAAHTIIRIFRKCEEDERFDVMMITKVEEEQTSFSFAVVLQEADIRKAQRKLLDIAMYMNP